jgi:hypothetical protein
MVMYGYVWGRMGMYGDVWRCMGTYGGCMGIYAPGPATPLPPLWCGGGVVLSPSPVVGVWYGMFGMYGVYGRSGMACLESMVCLVSMVGMQCMA